MSKPKTDKTILVEHFDIPDWGEGISAVLEVVCTDMDGDGDERIKITFSASVHSDEEGRAWARELSKSLTHGVVIQIGNKRFEV